MVVSKGLGIYEADIEHGHGQILGMAGARIAGGDFFPAQQLAAAGGAALACQWSEPSLLQLTHSHIHLSILFSRPRTICEKIRLVNI